MHGKKPVPESLFNKVAGLRPATLFKKRPLHRCFSVNFAKFLKHLFLQNFSGGCFCLKDDWPYNFHLSCVLFYWRFLVYSISTEKWNKKREIPGWSWNIYVFLEYRFIWRLRISKEIWQMVIWLGDCVPQPSVLGPYPRPSTPISSARGPPKYCKNKFMNKVYYLFKIILIQH